MVAAPGPHLLLCGPAAAWPGRTVRELERRGLHVHRLSRDPAPASGRDGSCAGGDDTALDRLGVRNGTTAHLLVRPDGYLAYRGGSGFSGLDAYLAAWLPR